MRQMERSEVPPVVRLVVNGLWARGFRFLFVLDAIGLYASMVAINLVRFGVTWPTYPLSHYVVGFAIATVIHLFIGYLSGLYQREPRLGRRPWLPTIVLAMVIGVGMDSVAFVVLDRYLMPRLNLLGLVVVGSLVLAGNRQWSRRLALRHQGVVRVALVGPAEAVDSAREHLAGGPHGDGRGGGGGGGDGDVGAVVVVVATETSGLAALVAKHEVSDVLLLDVHAFGQVFPEPLASLEALGVGVLQRVGAQETLLGLQSVREVAGMPFVRLRTHTMPSHKSRLKRGLDLVLLVAFSPMLVLVVGCVAVYARMVAGGPVLYRQVRLGRDGVPFPLIKFRTMGTDAERAGAVLATARDPRVVRGMAWMRSTRVDELPQIWNVVRGEMSLVGPRPERPEFAEKLAKLVPGYERRYELRPGITGLAQVQGRYHTDAVYKVGHDLQYLVNWSPVLDLQILLRTLWVVLARRV